MVSFLSFLDAIEADLKRPSTTNEYEFLQWLHAKYVAEQMDTFRKAQ